MYGKTAYVESLAEFNVLLPVNLLVALYDDDVSWPTTILTGLRLAIVYALAFSVYYALKVPIIVLAVLFVVCTFCFYLMPNRAGNQSSRPYYLLCTIMPTNYVLNSIAVRSNTIAHVYAVCQTIVRAMLIFIIVIEAYVYEDYGNAWSCYRDDPIKEYTLGPCPLYTHDYIHDWPCTDNFVNNTACLGTQSPAWMKSHWSRHGAIVGTTVLYTQHALSAVILD